MAGSESTLNASMLQKLGGGKPKPAKPPRPGAPTPQPKRTPPSTPPGVAAVADPSPPSDRPDGSSAVAVQPRTEARGPVVGDPAGPTPSAPAGSGPARGDTAAAPATDGGRPAPASEPRRPTREQRRAVRHLRTPAGEERREVKIGFRVLASTHTAARDLAQRSGPDVSLADVTRSAVAHHLTDVVEELAKPADRPLFARRTPRLPSQQADDGVQRRVAVSVYVTPEEDDWIKGHLEGVRTPASQVLEECLTRLVAAGGPVDV